MKKTLYALLCSSLLSAPAFAGFDEAIQAFNDQNYSAALVEFSYLSDEGNADASYYLGKMYDEGLGVTQDKEKALAYFKKSDAGYNTAATLALANAFLADDKIAEYGELGVQYLKKAAYAGSGEAFYLLGNVYAAGQIVPKDYTYAFGYYLLGALKGDKKAQHQVSMCYFKGRGTTQDYESGLKWLSKSANQGYVIAQQDLADFRATDPRLQNIPDAYAWYSIIAAYNTDEIGQRAAEKRDQLANSLKKTSQILDQQRKTRNWRPISAEQSVTKEDLVSFPKPIIPGFNDDETIQKTLESGETLLTDGSKYNISEDMIADALKSNDFTEMENTIEDAVQKGQQDAYAFYGDFVRTRRNDPALAVVWYQKGADINNEYAQYQLAKMYCEGTGVETPDAVKCYAYLLAAQKHDASGLTTAIKNALIAVEAAATPEELEKGRLLSDTFSESAQKKEAEASKTSSFNFF